MTRLLILAAVGLLSGTLAVLAFLPSMGHAGEQQGTDLAATKIPIADDVQPPAIHAGAFRVEPTGPFRRASVKADFAREAAEPVVKAVAADSGRLAQRQTHSNTSMPAPPATIATSELPVHGCRMDAGDVVPSSVLAAESASPQAATSGQQPGVGRSVMTRSDGGCALKAPALLPQPATERAEPSAVRYSLALTITREAASSTDTKFPLPSEPGNPSSGNRVQAIPSKTIIPGPISPIATRSVDVATTTGGHGPYPQCRYVGCSGPLACRECVYCDEIQHYDYYPALHGNYYFIPYNASKVPFQQAFGARFGGDPRVPYANGVFQTVYAAYRAAHLTHASGVPTPRRPEEVPPPEPTSPLRDDESHREPNRG